MSKESSLNPLRPIVTVIPDGKWTYYIQKNVSKYDMCSILFYAKVCSKALLSMS
jgi:hypothetical protein